ncbi:MAG: Fe-S cluster assembly protein SufD [Nitrospinota bacterium]|nr:Fe-S cluster assembly protein SufD [Nitrospinota bacterium]
MSTTLADKAGKVFKSVEGDFEAFAKSGARSPVFSGLNAKAMERLRLLGMYKKSDELFTYVSEHKLLKEEFGSFEPAVKPLEKGSEKADIYKGCEESVVVFVNGRFERSLSNLSGLQGAVVAELEYAADEEESGIAEEMAVSLDAEPDRYAALNGAFVASGVSIDVTAGAVIENYIQVLHITTSAKSPVMVTPRIFIRLRPGASARVVQKYIGSGENIFVNSVVDAVLENGATLGLCVLQSDGVSGASRRFFNFAKYRLRLEGLANFSGIFAQSGSDISRNHIEAHLTGEGAELDISGVAVTEGDDEAHSYVRVHHEAPKCRSNQVFKNIMKDRSKTSVDTTVVVHKRAQLTESHQIVNNLLLSESARMGGKPTLMIYADDVKCDHGSTVGQIDEDQVFYLKTRGIREDEARTLLTSGFANAVLEKIKFAPMKDDATRVLLSKLKG